MISGKISSAAEAEVLHHTHRESSAYFTAPGLKYRKIPLDYFSVVRYHKKEPIKNKDHPMKISMWTSFLYEMTPEEAVKTLKQHGFDCAEFSDEHARVLLDRGGNAEKIGREFKKYCDSLNFTLPQGHFYLHANLAEPDSVKRRELMEDLKRWCELFNALDIKAGVLHPTGLRESFPGDRERILENLQLLLDYSKGMSFTICLENLIVNYNRFEDLDELTRLLPSGDRLGFCLDTGHLFWNGAEPADFARKAGSRLKALHITDCIRNSEVRIDHIFPFSQGGINWAELMHALREISYAGIFNYEIPRERLCPQSIMLKKLDYARELARSMMEL